MSTRAAPIISDSMPMVIKARIGVPVSARSPSRSSSSSVVVVDDVFEEDEVVDDEVDVVDVVIHDLHRQVTLHQISVKMVNQVKNWKFL